MGLRSDLVKEEGCLDRLGGAGPLVLGGSHPGQFAGDDLLAQRVGLVGVAVVRDREVDLGPI